MIDISGASGRLKALYTYITTYMAADRMAKIDNLDTTLTSRAPASTALSTAVWTPGTADKINSGGIPGTVKSIQTGYANGASTTGSGEDTKYLDVTITAVSSTAKCVVLLQTDFYVRFISNTYGGYAETYPAMRSGRLTSTTNLRLSASGVVTSIVGRWTVIEYY